jgi:SAM-dependent methyltransferase
VAEPAAGLVWFVIMTIFDDPAFFGDRWASAYEDLTAGPDPASAVEFLAGLASPGARVLELAIGGGRVALPLARRGLQVEGVEASQAVVQRLRAAPGGESLPVVVADMADVPVPGPFGLVYVVWNSLFNLPSQARQVDCFRNVARVLGPDGAFVLECFVPDPAQFDRGVETTEVTEDSATVTLTRHDPVAQRIVKQHVTVNAQGIRLLPVALRYCWPSELDLMAQLAGLRLRERHGDWSRTPFHASSRGHISVYEPT